MAIVEGHLDTKALHNFVNGKEVYSRQGRKDTETYVSIEWRKLHKIVSKV